MAIYPTPEQIQDLLTGPADRPVVMVNLLRFKPRAGAPDEGLSGEDAYRRYADGMRTFVESRGGRFLWVGRVESQGSAAACIRTGQLDEAIEALRQTLAVAPPAWQLRPRANQRLRELMVHGTFLRQLGFCNPQTDVLNVFGGAELAPFGSGAGQAPNGLGSVATVRLPYERSQVVASVRTYRLVDAGPAARATVAIP
jgi:hypothetical protein